MPRCRSPFLSGMEQHLIGGREVVPWSQTRYSSIVIEYELIPWLLETQRMLPVLYLVVPLSLLFASCLASLRLSATSKRSVHQCWWHQCQQFHPPCWSILDDSSQYRYYHLPPPHDHHSKSVDASTSCDCCWLESNILIAIMIWVFSATVLVCSQHHWSLWWSMVHAFCPHPPYVSHLWHSKDFLIPTSSEIEISFYSSQSQH